ncbi:MAG: hypothetical protein HQ567_18455 [Candidatus Nealsonbacteria bacterium]|nr:hypothetical protein [Candidatus Nealsonbacteria bacterium]
MKLEHLVILLPCRSLEDFSLTRSPDDADGVLAAWSALWHPALLEAAGKIPTWMPAEEPPTDPTGHLVTVPKCSADLVSDEWLAQAEAAGACVIRDVQDRGQIVAEALKQLDEPAEIDPDLAADFLALGFCHLMIELLTRQLRYMSNLDEDSFGTAALAAAEHAAGSDAKEAGERLQVAFDLLHEAREYFYPVESRMLDLTLVAPSTLGEPLRGELAEGRPTNLLISGDTLRQMAHDEPATLKALADALKKETVGLIGGELHELPLPLLTPEAIRFQLVAGLKVYEEHLGHRPTVFGRRRFGLSPVLPQILRQLGFNAAMHCTLDDGRFPSGNQSRVQWEGIDGKSIEAVARLPMDVARADTFLRLPERLGDAMDLDHVATLVLAHWPGGATRWYGDVRRIASYTGVMGAFSTVDVYFDETNMSGQQVRYKCDQYRSPYLNQDVAADRADPISRWVRYHRRHTAAATLKTFRTLAACGSAPATTAIAPDESATDQLIGEIENSLCGDTDTDAQEDLDARLDTALHAAVARLAQSLSGSEASGGKGLFVANGHGFSRRVCVEMPPDGRSAMVDVPALGFAWVEPQPERAGSDEPPEPVKPKSRWRRKTSAKPEPPLAEENVLRNDFFEIAVDPYTGAIKSIHDYHTRGARLAQQLALRLPQPGVADPDDDAHYSIMAADELTVTSAGPIVGEIVCRGRLVDREARRLAGFTQTIRVHRGSRMIELDVELDPDLQPGPRAWQSYYAVRLAWNDATANLYRSVGLANLPTDAVQLEAPHFIDIRSDRTRTTILTAGLPYHRRFGLRKLDTLLIVRGEQARRFRLGIGIDLPHPVPAALDFLAPPPVLTDVPSPMAPTGWLFHLDSRNVVATDWSPVLVEGRLAGFRVRLMETDGRRVDLGLRCFRRPESAAKLRFDGTPDDAKLSIDGDRIIVPLAAHEWTELEARFVAK